MHAHARHRYVKIPGGEIRQQACPDFFFSSPSPGRGNADWKKKCPAVPLTCGAPGCPGDPTTGCASGSANDGCSCENPPAPAPPFEPQISCNKINCSDPMCQGNSVSPPSPFCQNPAKFNCPCTMENPNSAAKHCPSSISCSDNSCQGGGNQRQCSSTSLAGCFCRPDPSTPGSPLKCPGLSKCSDPSCDGTLLDGSALSGSNKLGNCVAPSLQGCPCRDT